MVVVCSAGSAFIVILILLIICWRQRFSCKTLTSNTQNTRDVTLPLGRQKRTTLASEEVELSNIENEVGSSHSHVSYTSSEQTIGLAKQSATIKAPDSEDKAGDTTTRSSRNEVSGSVNRCRTSSNTVRHFVKNGIPDIDFEGARFKENEIYESGDGFEVVEYAELEDQGVSSADNMLYDGSITPDKHTDHLDRVKINEVCLLHENQHVTRQQESTSQHSSDDNFKPESVHSHGTDTLRRHRESLLPGSLRHSYETGDKVCLSRDTGSVANIVYESYTESHFRHTLGFQNNPESADELNPGRAFREIDEDVYYSTIKDNDQFQEAEL